MALKVRIAKPAAGHHLRSRILLGLLAAFGCVALVGVCVFAFFYIKYTGIVDERLKQPIFANTAQIYAAPREVRPGQKLTVQLDRQRAARGRLHRRRRRASFATGNVQLKARSRSPCSPARSPITRPTAPPST